MSVCYSSNVKCSSLDNCSKLGDLQCSNKNNSLENKKKCLEIKYLECLKKSYKNNTIFENNCNKIITEYHLLTINND